MKRSSSKLITRARSVRNMGKVPFKFKFDLIVETIDKIAASGDVVLVWDRGNKPEVTKPAKIDKTSRKATFGNDKISGEVTMFKSAPSDRKFQEKVFKISVKLGSVDGKTLGKIHLNFADYAEVPSGSKRISAELNNGAILIASINSNFQGMGKALPGKQQQQSNNSSSSDDENGSFDKEDDTEDSNTNTTSQNDDEPGNFMKNKLAQKLTRGASMSTIGRRGGKSDEPLKDKKDSNSDAIDRLKRENNRLRKQVEELESQVGSNGGGSRTASSKLSEENHSLRNEIRDLKASLSREPAYADVVRELKEAKMALALLNLEKEEYYFELQKYRRGVISSPTSIAE